MITHALIILQNELKEHLKVYDPVDTGSVELGNMAEGVDSGTGNGAVPRGKLVFTIVNIKEEKTLKNLPNYVRNDTTQKAEYENPPVFLNFMLLVCATHASYVGATNYLSRAIRFFQHRHVFTQDNVAPDSLSAPTLKPLDQLETFKLILDLYSPSMEEVNHLWGTLGGKQYPFVLYMLRMLDLKFNAVQSESGLITEVVSDFYHKNAAN